MNIEMIPIDNNFEITLICAVRYACGRKTVIVSTICDYIKTLLPKLSTQTLFDISNSIDMWRNNNIAKLNPFGDKCDEECWIELYTIITNEYKKRLENE